MSSGISGGLALLLVLLFDLTKGLLGSGLVGLDRLGEVERVLGVLLDEGDEALQGAVTLVVNELLGAGGLELESGEAGNAEGDSRGEVVFRDFELGTRRSGC